MYQPRLSKGWTRKPCPGCGTTDGRPADKLCKRCETLLAEGKAAREAALVNPETRIYGTPWAPWTLYYSHRGRHYFNAARVREALGKAVYKLIDLTSTVAPGIGRYSQQPDGTPYPAVIVKPDDKRSDNRSDYTYYKRIFRPEIAETIGELDQAIHVFAAACYEDGFTDGQGLLQGLADGSLSVNEFNDRTIAGKGERR